MENPKDAMNKYAIIAKNPVSVGILGGKFKMLWKSMSKVDMEAAKRWAEDLAGTFRD
jgi:2',3'-cyclic-nucleotide 2'-phosphodiesterase (5'-nucleotidase family)